MIPAMTSALNSRVLQISCPYCGAEVRVDDIDKVRAIHVLKASEGLSMAEATAVLRSFPEIFSGTNAEAEWLMRQLAAANMSAHIQAA